MAWDLTHHRHHALIQLRFSDFVGRQFGVDTNHVHHVPAEDREVLLAKRFHQTPGRLPPLGQLLRFSFAPLEQLLLGLTQALYGAFLLATVSASAANGAVCAAPGVNSNGSSKTAARAPRTTRLRIISS